MTDRERWIVYPLLFLALGVSLRDKLTHSMSQIQYMSDVQFVGGQGGQLDLVNGIVHGRVLNVDEVRCRSIAVQQIVQCGAVHSRQMHIVDPHGVPKVSLGTTEKKDPSGPTASVGQVAVYGSQGQAVVLGSETLGHGDQSISSSTVTVLGEGNQVLARLGRLTHCREMYIIDPAGKPRLSLRSVLLNPETPNGAGNSDGNAQPAVAGQTTARHYVGRLAVEGADGQAVLALSASPAGGLLTVSDTLKQLTFILGHFDIDRMSGLVAQDASGKLVSWLGYLQRPRPVPKPDKTGPGPPEPTDGEGA